MGNWSACVVADCEVDELKNSSETRIVLDVRCMTDEEIFPRK